MRSDEAGQGGQVEAKIDTDVKAGALYGVKIWGWKRREEIERMQEICKNGIGGSS